MRHTTEWALAYCRFQTFRNSLPGLIDEDCVSEFRMVQARAGEHIAPRVGVQYSNKKYCDWEYFCCKLDGLQDFLNRFLDRTLLNSDSQVPEENERAVAEATRRGS